MQALQKGVVDIHGAASCQSYITEEKCPSLSDKTCDKKFDIHKISTDVNEVPHITNAIGVSENQEMYKCDTGELILPSYLVAKYHNEIV